MQRRGYERSSQPMVIGMSRKPKITMHFGGGALYLKCSVCNRDIGFREVDFPGTRKQQERPREELEQIKLEHIKKHDK